MKSKKPKMIKVNIPKPLRGQGEITKGKFYEKGDESIPNNKAGGYRSFTRGGKMVAQNRKEYRRKFVNRTYTASNYAARLEQKDSNGIKLHTPHKVNEHKVELTYAPSLTNNQRMKLREMGRIDRANKKKEMATV